MQIDRDIYYVGVNDHKVDLFEGQYIVPDGMSYNSYAIIDEKIQSLSTNLVRRYIFYLKEFSTLSSLSSC